MGKKEAEEYSPAFGSKLRSAFLLIMFNYNSEKWKRKRKSILARDSYKCQICKRYGKAREATEVHHIKHVDEYPELAYVDSNLVSLCRACHNKQHPEKGGRLGRYIDNPRG